METTPPESYFQNVLSKIFQAVWITASSSVSIRSLPLCKVVPFKLCISVAI
jgi:hypothetical protein